MEEHKRKKLEKAGFKIGNAEEFLTDCEDSMKDFDKDRELVRKAVPVLYNFMHSGNNLKLHAEAMVHMIMEGDEDDREAALSTLTEILFPGPPIDL